MNPSGIGLAYSEKVLALKDSPVQLFEHPENHRFYALHYDSAYVSIVDGASGKTGGADLAAPGGPVAVDILTGPSRLEYC